MIQVQVINDDKVAKKLASIGTSNLSDITNAVRAGAEDVQSNAVVTLMSGGRSGRTYKRGRKYHQASAAGEPAKSDSGNLVRHVGIQMVSKVAATVGVHQGVPYARILELGGYVRGHFFAARPWLGPSLLKSKPFIMRVIVDALNKHLRRAVK